MTPAARLDLVIERALQRRSVDPVDVALAAIDAWVDEVANANPLDRDEYPLEVGLAALVDLGFDPDEHEEALWDALEHQREYENALWDPDSEESRHDARSRARCEATASVEHAAKLGRARPPVDLTMRLRGRSRAPRSGPRRRRGSRRCAASSDDPDGEAEPRRGLVHVDHRAPIGGWR